MAITNASRLADFGSGIGTAGAVLQVDNTNQRIGIGTTNPDNMLQVGTAITMNGFTGVITATSFIGDGSGLTGLANTDTINADQLNVIGVTTVGSAVTISKSGIYAVSGIGTFSSLEGDGSALTGISGFATALSSTSTDLLNQVFKTPEVFGVSAGTHTIESDAASGNIAFSRLARIDVSGSAILTVSTGTTFIMNVLNVF